MYEFVYRIVFRDHTIRIVDTETLLELCEEQTDQIIQIGRIEVHSDDWHEVTAVTMRGIEAHRAHT